MKHKKTLTIKFQTLDQLEEELLALLKDRTVYIQPKDVIFFDSINSFRNFMTLQKLELLALIAYAHPKSIYELARMTNRGLAPVQSDCDALEAIRFIKFKKQKDGRKTITPKLRFNYDTILVELPDHPYELQFKAA